jgi:hypothetical protein
VWLLLGLAGGTGSGKTYSAMRLAKGLAGDARFGAVDTENGRASHYADEFAFDVVDLGAPFRPERYSEAIQTLADANYPVIVVDSMTHEWDGDGGMLEWHEQEMGGREAKNLAGWIKPKMAHRKFVTHLLQLHAHIILCFRAAERVEMVKNPQTGKQEIVPKRSLTGLDGWVPISEKTLPFELTLSLLLTPDAPGIPKPIKLQQQHRLLLPLDQPISEQTGIALAQWARGDAGKEDPEELPELITDVLAISDQLGKRDETTAAITKNRRKNAANLAAHADWLRGLLDRGRVQVDALAAEPEQDPFADLPPTEPSDPTPTEE